MLTLLFLFELIINIHILGQDEGIQLHVKSWQLPFTELTNSHIQGKQKLFMHQLSIKLFMCEYPNKNSVNYYFTFIVHRNSFARSLETIKFDGFV